MDSKEKIISEISTAVENLSLKIEALQAKVNELCKNTGDCKVIKNVNQKLVEKKQPVKEK